MTRTCIDCTSPISKRNDSGRCRKCAPAFVRSGWRRPTDLACLGCGKQLKASVTGRCRACCTKARFADPDWKAHHRDRLNAALRRPEVRANRAAGTRKRVEDPAYSATMRAARLKVLADPKRREKQIAAATKSLRDWHAANPDFDWSSFDKARVAKARAAKEAIEEAARAAEAERTRLAAMTPFERQMERVRNGARLIEKPVFRRPDHSFTLGGVAPEAM